MTHSNDVEIGKPRPSEEEMVRDLNYQMLIFYGKKCWIGSTPPTENEQSLWMAVKPKVYENARDNDLSFFWTP